MSLKHRFLPTRGQTNSRRVAPPLFECTPREPQVIVSAAAVATGAPPRAQVKSGFRAASWAARILAPRPASRASTVIPRTGGPPERRAHHCAPVAAPRVEYAPRSPCARRGSARRGGPAYCAPPLTAASGRYLKAGAASPKSDSRTQRDALSPVVHLFTPPLEMDTRQYHGALDPTGVGGAFGSYRNGRLCCASLAHGGRRSTTARNSTLAFWREAGTEPHYPLLESDVVPVRHARCMSAQTSDTLWAAFANKACGAYANNCRIWVASYNGCPRGRQKPAAGDATKRSELAKR
ncbi:hypothetical protein HPB50_026564 [Hyalomma asiaticum]|uniref:Uncharacterized protein n=1 Tax=Hyalomma asiaticum TaxID=266040 RepID=A0ACB7TRM0_HYAAI|nr:hypothetical protein HPB50_026564 [Hyalomma asiaticum]